MRIAIVTDAWTPQVNGVVNTLKATQQCLVNGGHEVLMCDPGDLPTYSCPIFPDIRLVRKPDAKVKSSLDAFAPDAIHIATEGPMGLAARRYCMNRGLGFTTSYHTRLPEYIRANSPLPMALTYRWLRWFHAPAQAVMAPTPGIKSMLERRGFDNVVLWGRGVDTNLFRPARQDYTCIARPLHLYVGRVVLEKNVDDFLRLDLPGSKWVIGDGPMREKLEALYPEVRFLGPKEHSELAAYYNCADVFVFPCRHDALGLVMAEAMACGVPVAAYPVDGPRDVVAHGRSGILDADLGKACYEALRLRKSQVRRHALELSWGDATQQFLRNLHPARKPIPDTMAPDVTTLSLVPR
jgi:glycosyltransferase involved in cell wall biosynthesis